ncbi:SDR family NAD(P)-dependent oxidoreductase [Planotetraspora mira]|uniref:Oxidoreductase n=1 Tax=Planotetraspora mira TaxID=58121 RepID=A0A8J3X8I7_9ACTN|nr:SDR family NAD(P)-dependent oxidoreductase [Planotetraspora mira]GII31805.1 oxidoreductase [Planotetraspora mira]
MGELDGRVALVTGASRGIGAAIAARFAAAGARVAVSARTMAAGTSRLPGTLEDTVGGIRAAGGTAEAFAADLSVPEDRERLAEQVREHYGDVDILVNNAAVTYFTPVADFTERRRALMFEVQVTAPMHLAQLFVPGMRARGSGWILNISSVAARHPEMPPGPYAGRGGTVYGMCKAAMERFSTGLAAELYADGIAVNSLAPTKVVPTPGTLFHHLTTEDDPNAEPPEVMAAAALALCRAPASELTGRIAYSQQLLAELGIARPTR